MGLRILEWAAIAFSRDLAYPGIEPASPTSPALAGGFFTTSATCKVRNLGSIPGFGRSPGVGKGYPLQYSGLENSMDCIVHEVAKNRT